MIEQIANNSQPLFESGSSTGQPIPPGAKRGSDVDVSIQVDYASLVEKAMQSLDTDDQQVQRARELLLIGELDSDEIIKGAVENLLMYGV